MNKRQPSPGMFARARAAVGSLFNRRSDEGRASAVRRVIGGRTGSGVYVDAETALKNATVWACIHYRSSALAQLPWRAMRDDPRLGKVVQDTNPVDWLLNERPNPEMGAFTFRQTLMQHMLRYGNGYAEIERDNAGRVYALWPLHPNRVEPKRDADGVLYYRVWNASGPSVDLDAKDVFHVRGLGDGAVGLSVFEFAADSVGWAQATEIFGATYFGEGMNPSGVVEADSSLSPEALELLREELDKLYKGPKGKRTVILDRGMKFNRLSTQPNDSQFIETRQHQVEEICRWFRVPPHKVMHLLRTTFSNIEHQAIEVVVDVVTPDVKVFEQEANYKLFGARNPQRLYTKISLQGLLRGDSKARSEFYWKLFQMGVLSPNQIAELEDRNGFGPDGDVRFVPVNMQPLDRALRPPAPPIGHNGGPPMDDDPEDTDEPPAEPAEEA